MLTVNLTPIFLCVLWKNLVQIHNTHSCHQRFECAAIRPPLRSTLITSVALRSPDSTAPSMYPLKTDAVSVPAKWILRNDVFNSVPNLWYRFGPIEGKQAPRMYSSPYQSCSLISRTSYTRGWCSFGNISAMQSSTLFSLSSDESLRYFSASFERIKHAITFSPARPTGRFHWIQQSGRNLLVARSPEDCYLRMIFLPR